MGKTANSHTNFLTVQYCCTNQFFSKGYTKTGDFEIHFDCTVKVGSQNMNVWKEHEHLQTTVYDTPPNIFRVKNGNLFQCVGIPMDVEFDSINNIHLSACKNITIFTYLYQLSNILKLYISMFLFIRSKYMIANCMQFDVT